MILTPEKMALFKLKAEMFLIRIKLQRQKAVEKASAPKKEI